MLHPRAGVQVEPPCAEPKIPTGGDQLPKVVGELVDFESNIRTLKTLEYTTWDLDGLSLGEPLLVEEVHERKHVIPAATALEANQQEHQPTTDATVTTCTEEKPKLQEQKQTPQKRPSPAERVGSFLRRAKAARLAKQFMETKDRQQQEQSPKPADSVQEQTQEQQEPTDLQVVVPALQPLASNETLTTANKESTAENPTLMELYEKHVGIPLPKDWNKTEYVSADQQQPPKPRGRKPKTEPKAKPAPKRSTKRKAVPLEEQQHDEPVETQDANAKAATHKAEPKKAAETKSKSSTASQQPKTKAKRRSKNSKGDTAEEALNAMPIPKEHRGKAKKLSPMSKSKATKYEAATVDETCNHWDAYAVASAAADVARVDPDKNDKTAPQDAVPNTVSDNDQKQARKKQLSRKSCAYKKARALAIKAGKSQAEAAEAGNLVRRLLHYQSVVFLTCVY